MKDQKIIVQKKKLAEMTDEEINVAKYRSLERRYNSIIDAIKLLEDQNELFRNEIEMCYKKMENAQKNVEINKTIVVNTIMDSNNKIQSYLGEITDLKNQLRNNR